MPAAACAPNRVHSRQQTLVEPGTSSVHPTRSASPAFLDLFNPAATKAPSQAGGAALGGSDALAAAATSAAVLGYESQMWSRCLGCVPPSLGCRQHCPALLLEGCLVHARRGAAPAAGGSRHGGCAMPKGAGIAEALPLTAPGIADQQRHCLLLELLAGLKGAAQDLKAACCPPLALHASPPAHPIPPRSSLGPDFAALAQLPKQVWEDLAELEV